MAGFSAADVKRLREETDAPMLECSNALKEAEGEFDRAKEILQEKGKAAAAKRQDRTTSEGVVAFATNPSGNALAGVVVECETDFVARNDEFIALAQKVADTVLETGATTGDDPRIKEMLEGAVAKIRENIRLAKAVQLNGSGKYLTYVHHDKTKGAAVQMQGEAHDDVVRKVAIQAVAFPPEVLSRDELSQEDLQKQLELEKQRAINEGKPENIAENIAKGRVNKEFVQKVVLLEQPFYLEPSKTVKDYLKESAKGSTVSEFVYLAVGQG